MTNGTYDTRTADPPTPRPGQASQPGQQPVTSRPRERLRALPAPVVWGAVWGVLQAMSPLGFWWLEPKTVYALGLPLIAAGYCSHEKDHHGRQHEVRDLARPLGSI